jgi:hypothetical protein
MTTLKKLEAVLIPRGFKIIPGVTEPGPVFGKIVQDGICLRVYSYCDRTGSKPSVQPFLLKFVVREGNKIVKIGSERRVHTHQFDLAVWQAHLGKSLDEWEIQLNQEDTTCNKCGGSGMYSWTSPAGNECQGTCNRCGGKGYQDFNDRLKNFYYDRRVERMTGQGADDDGEVYADWVPHWVPDPENFEDPNFMQSARQKKRSE